MEISKLDQLPNEVQLMILNLLEPDDIKSTYSTSRLWRELSEAQYAKLHFSNQTVYIEAPSLQRLVAISQNDRCRKRVREVILVTEYIETDADIKDSLEWGGEEVSVMTTDSDVKWLLASHAATSMLTSALMMFDNCKNLTVSPQVWRVRDWQLHDTPRNIKVQPTKSRFKHLVDMSHYDHEYTVQVLETAIAALRSCHQIQRFEFTNESGYIGTKFGLSILKPLHQCEQLSHIRELELCPDMEVWSPELSRGCLKPFLASFRCLRKLIFSAYELFPAHEVGDFSFDDVLTDGLEVLHLGNFHCSVNQLTQLATSEHTKTLTSLNLRGCVVQGGLEGWVTMLKQLSAHRKLECFEIVQPGWSVGEFGRYFRSYATFVFRDVNNTTLDDYTRAFRERAVLSTPP